MTTTLRIAFPWGLYHATPWNRSANEGSVEWPPSPWRVLRALYSAWKVHVPDLSDADVLPVLAALASPPSYRLPAFTAAHSRHYMPGSAHLDGVATDTAKTLDAFVVTERDAEIEILWDVELASQQRVVLAALVAGVRYLGRAESVVDVTLVEGGDAEPNISITDETNGAPATQLLAPELPLAVDSLILSPQQVRSGRRLLPPSTRWLTYQRPIEMRPRPHRPRPTGPRPTAIRLAIAGAVLPSRYETVALGHLARAAAMNKHHDPSATLAGKDHAGTKLGGAHVHAHYLPLSTDGRRIDSLIAWASAGFVDTEVAAFESLQRIFAPAYLDGLGTRRVAFVGAGPVDGIAPELVGPSRRWMSVTPYCPVGHFRGTLLERLTSDVNRELSARGLPPADGVEMFDGPWLRYRRYRPGKERIQGSRPAYGLVLHFDEPVTGPLALGQLSHFGLGLFQPRL